MSRRNKWLIALGAVLGVLVALHFSLPVIVKHIVETKQANMPGGYQAKVDHVEWRKFGTEIALCGFTITKKNGKVPVPFLQAKEFDLITERDGWKPRTVMRYVQPVFNWVDSEDEAQKQTGPEDQINQLRSQVPFELARVEVIGGTAHFRNFDVKPALDVYAQNLNVRWENLVGCLPPGNSACKSQLRGDLKLMKSGTLKIKGRFARNPINDFHVVAHLRGLRGVELNSVFKQYVRIKMAKGELALDARYDRRGDRHDALLIPLLDDIEVDRAEGEDKSFLRKVGAGIAAGWFERKRGEKGIAITKKPNGATDFEIVDKPDVGDPKDAKADD